MRIGKQFDLNTFEAINLYNEAKSFEQNGITGETDLRRTAERMYGEGTMLTIMDVCHEVNKVLANEYITLIKRALKD